MTTIIWADASGLTFDISATYPDDAFSREGIKGRGAPPTRSARDRTPGQPGSTIRTIEDDTRTIEIPIGIHGTTAAALSTAVEAWIERLDPNRGDGTLTFTTGAGATRAIRGRCMNGLDIHEQLGAGTNVGWVWWNAEFECDPYFYDPSDASGAWTVDDGATLFPFLPLQLASSAIFASPVITNSGKVDTYPVWTISGPCSGVILTDTATGRVLAWNGALGLGESLVLDTRPSNQSDTPNSMLLGDGTDVFAQGDPWDFWPLQPGGQNVQIELAGATANTGISARWRNWYRSGY